MALYTQEINGETWYFDGDTRIDKTEYARRVARKNMAIRRIRVGLDGKLTEVVNDDNN